MMDAEPHELAEADSAAEEGRWGDALGLRLAAIKAHALAKLEAAGAFSNENLASIGPLLADMAEPADLAKWREQGKWPNAILDEMPLSGLELAVLAFAAGRPEPSPKAPLPVEDAAGLFLGLLMQLLDLLPEVAGELSEERFNSLCELAMVSAEIGAVSEAFRAEIGGFASALHWPDLRTAGGQKGAEGRQKAAKWQAGGLVVAQQLRAARPRSTKDDIAAAIREAAVKGVVTKPLPKTPRGLEVAIEKWERRGKLRRKNDDEA